MLQKHFNQLHRPTISLEIFVADLLMTIWPYDFPLTETRQRFWSQLYKFGLIHYHFPLNICKIGFCSLRSFGYSAAVQYIPPENLRLLLPFFLDGGNRWKYLHGYKRTAWWTTCVGYGSPSPDTFIPTKWFRNHEFQSTERMLNALTLFSSLSSEPWTTFNWDHIDLFCLAVDDRYQ